MKRNLINGLLQYVEKHQNKIYEFYVQVFIFVV